MKLIGDPHLGREFKRNVPLDRRGEREEMMRNQFWDEIHSVDDLIVIVGDLFDHWHISFESLQWTLQTIQNWSDTYPKKKLIILQGNHDYSPSKGVYGAFDILDIALAPYDNIRVVRSPETLCGVMFFPWQWDRSALEQLDDIKLWTDTAVGHWDLADYGGDTGHLCPAAALKARGVSRIYSGHWHLAGVYNVDGVDVTCTGSMQPMTHAEDPDGKMYVTLTVDEYNRTSEESLRDKYVRVITTELDGIQPPASCLGFQLQRRAKEHEAQERVTLGDFDIQKILDKQLKAHDVPKDVAKGIKERLVDIT